MTTMEHTDQGEALDTRIEFTNGFVVAAPARVLAGLKGIDAEGLLIVEDLDCPGFRYTLTDCCFASAKGSMGATVCRGCYEEIDDRLGGMADPIAGTVKMFGPVA